MGYKEIYNEWLTNAYFDADTKAELERIASDENEIKERFYTDLEFGTAGLRGIIGAGTNRMNIYTVRKATQGLANYILKSGNAEKGVAIAFDSRRMSPEFAQEAACCLAANGIKAYVFDSLRPTPELSYAVRKLGCIAGINITASHNPPEYNGYKVYWEDGAQITPPHDKGIMDEVKAVTDYTTMISQIHTLLNTRSTHVSIFVRIFSGKTVPSRNSKMITIPRIPGTRYRRCAKSSLDTLSVSIARGVHGCFHKTSAIPPAIANKIPLIARFFRRLTLQSEYHTTNNAAMPIPM